ncbi:MAG: ABC transporter ATP-binding protein/permease [Acidobacteriota bacterium]|nr:ABC transporter ATP-binding protein/permease [Acidobacteriota bacterium]
MKDKFVELLHGVGLHKRFEGLKTLPKLLRVLWRAAPRLVSTLVALRVATALIPLAMLAVSKLIIDIIVGARTHPTVPAGSLWPWLLLEFVLAAAALVMTRGIDYCDSRIAEEFTRQLSLDVMEHTSNVDLASLEDPNFHDKLERARVQATDRSSMLTALGSLVQSSLMTVSLALSVAGYAPWLLALMALCVIPGFAGETAVTFEGYSLGRRLTPLRRELDYLRTLGSSRESAKEVKMFSLARFLNDRYRKLSTYLIADTTRLARRRFLWGSLLGVLASLGYYGGYAFLVLEALAGRITVGTLTFLAGAIAGANVQLQSTFTYFSSVSEQTLFLTDVVDLLAVVPTIHSKPHAIPVPRPIKKGFEFRNVSFRYPGGSWVLRHLNLSITPGERIALVGENGQGKTTLVKLLTRLYEPVEGEILLDGIDLRDYLLHDLRREVGVIFQDFFRYDMSVRINIGIGREDRLDDDEAIWQAARQSRASQFIDAMPWKLEQMLGKRFEGGTDLSGGQWQKVALSRAYIRDAQLLILDEPTASLDAAAESEVFDNFARLTEDRMAILISHRFSTVRMADRIVVLKGGTIGEDGTHAELIAAGGQYARLFELQAANYR